MKLNIRLLQGMGFLLLVIFTLAPIMIEVYRKDNTIDWNGVVRQSSSYDCGAATLTMILRYHKIDASLSEVQSQLFISENGTSMNEIVRGAKLKGLIGEGWLLNFENLKAAPTPLVVLLNDTHFVVVDSILQDFVYIRDPLRGHSVVERRKFMSSWKGECIIFSKTFLR